MNRRWVPMPRRFAWVRVRGRRRAHGTSCPAWEVGEGEEDENDGEDVSGIMGEVEEKMIGETATATTGKIELDRLLRMFRSGTLLGASGAFVEQARGHRSNKGAEMHR